MASQGVSHRTTFPTEEKAMEFANQGVSHRTDSVIEQHRIPGLLLYIFTHMAERLEAQPEISESALKRLESALEAKASFGSQQAAGN